MRSSRGRGVSWPRGRGSVRGGEEGEEEKVMLLWSVVVGWGEVGEEEEEGGEMSLSLSEEEEEGALSLSLSESGASSAEDELVFAAEVAAVVGRTVLATLRILDV